METFSNILQPYKNIVGTIAGIVTSLQFLSGAVVCNDIRKKGSTEGFPIMPFLGGAVFAILGLQYAVILRDDAMIRVNFAGLATSIGYVCWFYIYTVGPQKNKVWGQIGLAGAISAAAIAYAKYENPDLVETRFGTILSLFLICLVAAPLLDLGEIVRKKSTEGLPFPIILSGTVVSFMWFIYGIILNNLVVVLQNLLVFGLSAFQLGLFVVYPSRPTVRAFKNKKKAN